MKSVLIFSGSNDRAIVAFCRFALKNNIAFKIIANGKDDLINYTEFKQHIIATRKKNILDLDDVLAYCEKIRLITEKKEVFILPSTEFLNRFLLEHEKTLKTNFISHGLCGERVYHTISDKYSFNELCEKNNLKVPQEYSSIPDHFPFIIKPKVYKSVTSNLIDKPGVIFSKLELEDYIKNKNINDFYFQEYIGGRNFYLLFYISENGNYSVYSQENLMQQADGGSMVLARSSNVHENKISQDYAEMLVDFGFKGLIMVDLKYYNKHFYMIEANPRLWGPSQLILDSGMDLFDMFCEENNLISKKEIKPYKNNVWYFWSGGIGINEKNKKELTTYNFSAREFLQYYSTILKSEVYLKNDSLNLYYKEASLKNK